MVHLHQQLNPQSTSFVQAYSLQKCGCMLTHNRIEHQLRLMSDVIVKNKQLNRFHPRIKLYQTSATLLLMVDRKFGMTECRNKGFAEPRVVVDAVRLCWYHVYVPS